MMRFCPDYNDESYDLTQKLVKKEEYNDSTSSHSTEAEQEARIIRDFYQLCAKKHIEKMSHLPIFPPQAEHSTYPFPNHIMFPQQTVSTTQNFQEYLSNTLPFKPLIPSPPSYQELQYYQTPMKDMSLTSLNSQIKYSPVGYESPLLNSESTKTKDTIPKEIKNPQSKYKNCYGLVTGRVIKSIKEYLKLVQKEGSADKIDEDSRLYYIHKKIGHLSSFDKFESFLKEYHTRSIKEKRNRGKMTVHNYLSRDKINGLILVELIQDFLGSQNLDFKSYTSKGKKHIAEVLKDEKNQAHLREAFEEMQADLEKL